MSNIPQLTKVQVLESFKLSVEFSDGTVGTVDLAGELDGEVFEPLQDVTFFRKAQLHKELNTVAWPNGADIAPEYLYSKCVKSAKAA